MKPVMCITKDNLQLSDGINKFKINPDDIHFINRNIVDSKLPEYHAVGTMLPQLLPYIFVKCGNEYLTYARKGKETRLHGKRSMGFGGHVELEDLDMTPLGTLHCSAKRELNEELGLDTTLRLTDEFIYSTYDLVSQVHIGIIGFVEITDKSLVTSDEAEVLDPQWKTVEQIRANLDTYERWSQILAKHLDKLSV